MTALRKVIWGCGCEDCGDDVEIDTDATQPDPPDGTIYVCDGDRGVCLDCGLSHHVSLDEESPPELYASWPQPPAAGEVERREG